MNFNEIENLKAVLMKMVKKGCTIKSDNLAISGRIVGMGFKPYWTNPLDSKIDKMEFNYKDNSGRVAPFYLHNVIGYDFVSYEDEKLDAIKNLTVDFYVFSDEKSREPEPFDKVTVSFEIGNI